MMMYIWGDLAFGMTCPAPKGGVEGLPLVLLGAHGRAGGEAGPPRTINTRFTK